MPRFSIEIIDAFSVATRVGTEDISIPINSATGEGAAPGVLIVMQDGEVAVLAPHAPP
jgi:hypothetical protein